MKRTKRTDVDIRIPVPTALHARLRHRAFDEGTTLRDVVLTALEAWVAPTRRQSPSEPDLAQVQAQVVDEVMAILCLPLTREQTGERILALKEK